MTKPTVDSAFVGKDAQQEARMATAVAVADFSKAFANIAIQAVTQKEFTAIDDANMTITILREGNICSKSIIAYALAELEGIMASSDDARESLEERVATLKAIL